MMRHIAAIAVCAAALLSAPHLAAAADLRADDPLFLSNGSWGQAYDDQWAMKRIGFDPAAGETAWDLLGDRPHPVVVAVIDSGLDFYHPDIDPRQVWRNEKEIRNGIDDDGNGYVDDLIGWDFVDGDNNPFDRAGHGTHVAGIIIAKTGNGQGIAGINPMARVMPLRVLNFLGGGTNANVAEAIVYAVRNGARIINLSLGHDALTEIERRALGFAQRSGVLVTIAAGNTATDTADFGMASLEGLLIVGATDFDDNHAGFSNAGRSVRIAAPGLEVLSLRARGTDLMQAIGVANYEPGAAIVDAAYYRTSGTSFAAPMVAGVASLLLSRDPTLSVLEVTRMIVQSARDVGTPGIDRFTGYGLLDARAALKADPEFYVVSHITGVRVARKDGKPVAEVLGTVAANRLAGAWLELGKGEEPTEWKRVADGPRESVDNGVVGAIPAGELRGSKVWFIRLITQHENGRQREARFRLKLG